MSAEDPLHAFLRDFAWGHCLQRGMGARYRVTIAHCFAQDAHSAVTPSVLRRLGRPFFQQGHRVCSILEHFESLKQHQAKCVSQYATY